MKSRVSKRSKVGVEMPPDQRLSCIVLRPTGTIIDGIRVQRPQSHCYAGQYCWPGRLNMKKL